VYIGGSFDNTGGNPLANRVAVYRTVGIEPTVVSIDLVGASTVTNPTSLQFVVTFSEPVTNVTADDFTLTTTGTPITATVSSVSGSGAVYTVNVTVSGGTAGTATVRLDLKPGTNITDLNGVGGIPAYTTGPAYTVNLVVPTLSIQLLGTSPITNPTSVPLSFLVTFSEPVTNVTADDFTLTTTGGITVTITGVSGSGAVYTVNTAVGGGTAGTATVRLDLKPNTDIAGTGLSIVGTVPAYTTGPAYTVNLVAPTVQAIQLLGTSPITNPTSLSFPFLVIFSEPVTNVTADDFALTTTGGITATVSSVSGSGAVYTVNTTVDGGTLPPTSTLRLDLKPNTDIVGSVSNVSGTPPYTTGPAYAITSIRVYLPIIVRP
jgi:membrane-bound inhibitor of C-type lysozyme